MKKLNVTRDGLKVYAELYLPQGSAEKWPIIIFAHGFTAFGGAQQHFAQVLNQEGIGFCLLDFCGGGWKSRSQGDSTKMSVMTEVEDLRAVHEVLKKEERVDLENIFLMGNSQGGLVSALYGLKVQDALKGLILNFPAFIIPFSARNTYQSLNDIPDKPEVFGYPLGKKYYEDIWDLDIYEEIQKFDNEVLIVHGDQDQVVPLEYSKKALDMYPHARLVVIPGAGHGYKLEEDKILLEETISFIKERLA